MKTQPIGICDLCLAKIPKDRWYTSKGQPRRYCSRTCRNTANSRAGASVRSEKTRRAIALGQWKNPAEIRQPDPEKMADGVRRARLAEVQAGTWRNPALDPAAREKLSRPRKYSNDLAQAIEKLRYGKMIDLTESEHAAYMAYRRELYRQRQDEARAASRAQYAKRQATLTPEQREKQRERWRAANKQKSQRTKKSPTPMNLKDDTGL